MADEASPDKWQNFLECSATLDCNGLGMKDGEGAENPQRKMVIASNPDDSNDPIVASGNCLPHFDFAQCDT